MRRLVLSALSINALGFGLALPAAPAAAQQWREITCESRNYREAHCPVPGAVRVQLLRVRGGDCIEGQSWYQDGNAIHVRNGCRAVFRIDANNGWGVGGWDPNQGNGPGNGPGGGQGWGQGGGQGWGQGGGQGQVVRCESWNFRDQRCPVQGAIGGVRLLRVIAGDCRDGATWRWDRRAISVRGGCRADFEVQQGASGWGNGGGGVNGDGWGNNGGGWGSGGGVGGGAGGGRPVSITCESWNFRAANCAAPRGRQVRLSRVLGGNCVEGRTWGVSPGQLWVNGGCRAVFDVY